MFFISNLVISIIFSIFVATKMPNIMDEKDRILQLRRELHEHNHRYYVLNQPVISDQEFDYLMHELQDLEVRECGAGTER